MRTDEQPTLDNNKSRGGVNSAAKITDSTEGTFVRVVGGALAQAVYRGLEHEAQVTLQVAVLLATDHTAQTIQETLGIDKLEYAMVCRRLQTVGKSWVG